MDQAGRTQTAAAEPTYGRTARRFHWWTVALIAVQVPVGFTMAYRGGVLDIWDALTNNLYSLHKLMGVAILVLVLVRLTYRVVNGAPPDVPTLTWYEKAASHMVHWSLYGLLIAVPIAGWIGVSQFPALDVFGLLKLPALVPENNAASATTLSIHRWLAILTVLLIGAHVGGALFHYAIRKDGVLARMLPSLRRTEVG